MEFESCKSVWLDEGMGTPDPPSAQPTSQPLRLLRSSAIRDWERSRRKSRVIFSFLFAFSAAIAAFAALPPGGSPIAALFLAAALLIQGVTEAKEASRRHQDSARSMRDYLALEHRHATIRFRLERYSQGSLLIITLAVLVLVIGGPRPVESPALEMDRVASLLILTVLLAMAWLKARAVALNRQISQELESYLRELER